jgi:hypothetical protein
MWTWLCGDAQVIECQCIDERFSHWPGRGHRQVRETFQLLAEKGLDSIRALGWTPDVLELEGDVEEVAACIEVPDTA